MRKLLLLALLLLPLSVAACGKKGSLEVPPETAQDRGNGY